MLYALVWPLVMLFANVLSCLSSLSLNSKNTVQFMQFAGPNRRLLYKYLRGMFTLFRLQSNSQATNIGREMGGGGAEEA